MIKNTSTLNLKLHFFFYNSHCNREPVIEVVVSIGEFFKASALRNFHSIQLSGSSHQKVFLSRSFGNLNICISASASSLKLEFFAFRIFFEKIRIFMFFLVLSYGISATLLQILISLSFPIHPSNSGHWCSGKRLFEVLEASVHWRFEKITSPKISSYFPAKHQGWNSF